MLRPSASKTCSVTRRFATNRSDCAAPHNEKMAAHRHLRVLVDVRLQHRVLLLAERHLQLLGALARRLERLLGLALAGRQIVH